MRQHLLPALLLPFVAGCTVAVPPAEPVAKPLDTLPAEAGIATARSDLLATAGTRFGKAALDRALAAPTHIIVKRFAGMAPPPPPGAGPDWRVPTPSALLIRDGSAWLVATDSGWRPAKAESATQLDQLLADRRLWSEPVYTPPCPDYGAQLLLLKLPGKTETVRNSLCDSIAARVVEAALHA